MAKTSTLNSIIGVLGLWVTLVMFLDFSTTLTRIILIISGLLVAALSFWAASDSKIPGKSDSEIIPSPNSSFENKNPDEKPAKEN